MKNTRKSVMQLIKFSIIGSFNTLLDYILFWLFLNYFHIDKNLSQIMSYTIAMSSSFLMNKQWTFDQKGRLKSQYVIKFATINICALILSITLINFFYYTLQIHNWANCIFNAIGINVLLSGKKAILFAKLISSPFTFALNFLGDKKFVFKTDEKNWPVFLVILQKTGHFYLFWFFIIVSCYIINSFCYTVANILDAVT